MCNHWIAIQYFERHFLKDIELKKSSSKEACIFLNSWARFFQESCFKKQPAVSRNFWIKYRILWSDWGKEMCWIDSWKYFARPPGWGAWSLKDFIKYSWLLREMSFHVKDLDLWKSAVHPSPKSPSSNNLRIFFSLMTFDALLWSSILEVCQENFWYCRWAIWSRKKKKVKDIAQMDSLQYGPRVKSLHLSALVQYTFAKSSSPRNVPTNIIGLMKRNGRRKEGVLNWLDDTLLVGERRRMKQNSTSGV